MMCKMFELFLNCYQLLRNNDTVMVFMEVVTFVTLNESKTADIYYTHDTCKDNFCFYILCQICPKRVKKIIKSLALS